METSTVLKSSIYWKYGQKFVVRITNLRKKWLDDIPDSHIYTAAINQP